MSVTKIITGREAREKLRTGAQILNKAVSVTLGPSGRNVIFNDSESGVIRNTKDGVSVAKQIRQLEDPIENFGAQLVKEVAIKTAKEVGDGTTTSVLLAASMIEAGLEAIDEGSNVVEIKKGMDRAVELIVGELKKLSQPIINEDQIKQIATISGNNDPEIGILISTALEKVGRDGVVTIEESKTGVDQLEVVEGMQFDRGYKSHYFVTDNITMQTVLHDPYILIYDGRLTLATELLEILQKVSMENKPLLVIAEEIDNEALALLLVNKARGIISACAVKAPDFGERRTLVLEDLAVITGGSVISKTKLGMSIDKIKGNEFDKYLGKATTVTVSKDKTTIIDGKGNEQKIKERALEIKSQLDKAESSYEKQKLQERLGKLIGGIAVISVGGLSDVEIKEKKDRVEDALFAAKAGIAEGIVYGGGAALISAVNVIDYNDLNGDILKGFNIVKQAVHLPFKTILANAGVEYGKYMNAIIQGPHFNYNVKTDKFDDELLVDPTKVVRLALENATSIASLILTSETIVYEHIDKKELQQNTQPNQEY